MTTSETIDVAGRPRTFQTALPTAPAGAPLVLVFHGSNQTASSLRTFVGGAFDDFATRDGAVVAFLDGYKRNWNDARAHSAFPARLEGYDDVAFATAVIDLLLARHGLDPARVFAVGFSNGGAFVIRLVHEIGERLAGAAVVAATLPEADDFAVDRDSAHPVPFLAFHGTRDRLVPYEGGMASLWGFKPRGLGLSATASSAYFAARNGITSAGVVSEGGSATASRGMSIERLDHQDPGRQPVRLVTIEGGGHTIPGRKKAPFVMGRTATRLSAVDEIARFFGLR